MEDSERVAIAAHLHVALRRKTGRVTDTEWMATNLAYGQAMVAFAMAHAHESGDEELERLALRLDAALMPKPAPRAARAAGAAAPARWTDALKEAVAPPPPQAPEPGSGRYVGGLR